MQCGHYVYSMAFGKATIAGSVIIGPLEMVTTKPLEVIPGRTEAVTLKCGKGMSKVVLPTLKFTKPTAEQVSYPRLTTLQQDIQTIMTQSKVKVDTAMATANENISKQLDTAKGSIDGEIKKIQDNITLDYNSLIKTGLDQMKIGFDDMFVNSHRFYIYKYELGKGKYYVYYADGIGWLTYKLQVMGTIRSALGLGGDEWWKVFMAIWGIIGLYEKWVSLSNNKEELDHVVNSGMNSAMKNMTDGLKSIVGNIGEFLKRIVTDIGTAIKNILTAIANAIKAIIPEIGNAIKSIVSIISDALTQIGAKLAVFADQLVQAIISQVKNAVNEALAKTVDGLNTFSNSLSQVYNSVVITFNTSVLEPLQCAVKDLQDKYGKFKLPGFKLPSLPGLPGFGGGGGGFEPWSRDIMTAITGLSTQIATLNVRVSALERK